MDQGERSASVIVPVYNDPEGIRQTLASLTANVDSRFEVLVVDNGSSDGTRDVIRDFTNDADRITLLVEDDVQSSYAARNRGIENASGEVLAFLDADETVEEGWLDTALETMDDLDVDYLGCRVELTLDENTLVGKYNAHTGFPVKRYLRRENYAPTCALLVRREVLDDAGLLDSRLISGGDIEFGHRVHAAGYEQGYAEDAVVTHPARTSLESLAKKNVRVGRGFCRKQRYHPDRYGSPGIPPTPSGSGSEDSRTPEALRVRIAFAFLSVAMLACRAAGYYYEFLVGSRWCSNP